MDTQTRNRPNLEVDTKYDYDLPDGLPRATLFRRHQSPMSALSPLSVKPLPSPRQLSADTTGAKTPFPGERLGGTSLAPIAEQAMVAQVGLMSMDSPINRRAHGLPVTAPNTPGTPTAQCARNRSMAEQTRNILLSGMTLSQANDLGTVANRRLSAPADILQKQRRQSMLLMQPDKLQDWGHVYLDNPTKADVFVAPSALRRQSGVYIKLESTEENRVAIRARVRPRSKDRKPFVIARKFDLNLLQTTIPSPTMSPSSRRPSLAPLSPEDLLASARTPTSPLVQSTLARSGRRSSMAASGLRFGDGQQMRPGSKEFPIRKSLIRASHAIFMETRKLEKLIRPLVWCRLLLCAIVSARIGSDHALWPYQDRRLDRLTNAVPRGVGTDVGLCVYWRRRADGGHQTEHLASWRASLDISLGTGEMAKLCSFLLLLAV